MLMAVDLICKTETRSEFASEIDFLVKIEAAVFGIFGMINHIGAKIMKI